MKIKNKIGNAARHTFLGSVMKKSGNYLPLTNREKSMVIWFLKFNLSIIFLISAWIVPVLAVTSHFQHVSSLEVQVSKNPEKTLQAPKMEEIVATPAKAATNQGNFGRFTMDGKASYYDYTLASGWSSIGHFVCATRDFKRYSTVKVTNLANGKTVNCKVTDYGPDASIFPDRIIDLSSTSFAAIADTKLGVIDVTVEQL